MNKNVKIEMIRPFFSILKRDKNGTNQKLSDQHARIIKVSPMIW